MKQVSTVFPKRSATKSCQPSLNPEICKLIREAQLLFRHSSKSPPVSHFGYTRFKWTHIENSGPGCFIRLPPYHCDWLGMLRVFWHQRLALTASIYSRSESSRLLCTNRKSGAVTETLPAAVKVKKTSTRYCSVNHRVCQSALNLLLSKG
jgi:hypothetical protein